MVSCEPLAPPVVRGPWDQLRYVKRGSYHGFKSEPGKDNWNEEEVAQALSSEVHIQVRRGLEHSGGPGR